MTQIVFRMGVHRDKSEEGRQKERRVYRQRGPITMMLSEINQPVAWQRGFLETLQHFCHLHSSVSYVSAIQKKQLQLHTFIRLLLLFCYCLPGLANLPSSCCASGLAGNDNKVLRVSRKHRCRLAYKCLLLPPPILCSE